MAVTIPKVKHIAALLTGIIIPSFFYRGLQRANPFLDERPRIAAGLDDPALPLVGHDKAGRGIDRPQIVGFERLLLTAGGERVALDLSHHPHRAVVPDRNARSARGRGRGVRHGLPADHRHARLRRVPPARRAEPAPSLLPRVDRAGRAFGSGLVRAEGDTR